MWTDAHCHIHDERIPDGTAGAVAAAVAAGVTRMVTVGCDRATSLAAIETAQKHDEVLATVGLHPHDAKNGIDSIADLLTADAVRTHQVVAVGEAGLDYYYDHSPRNTQREVFASQIQLAHELGLPLVIHTRDAWDDTFDVLDAEGTPEVTMFHCFTGGPTEARRCLERNGIVSFSGIVTFPKAPEVREAAALCPLDQLLVETDSPYLAPAAYRGKPNRPAWVTEVGAQIAEIHGVDAEEVAAATTATANSIFRSEPHLPD